MSIANDLPLPQTITFQRAWRGQKEGAKVELLTAAQVETALGMVDEGLVKFDNPDAEKLTPKRRSDAAKRDVAKRESDASEAAKSDEAAKNAAASKPSAKTVK